MASDSTSSGHVRSVAQSLLHQLQSLDSLANSLPDTDRLYLRVAAVINDCLTSLGPLNLWGQDNRLPSSELWNAAGHLLAKGWLQNQARTKPRGYAGDHEMLARIYEQRLCDDPLGRLFDRYFQEQAAPQAVRNRMTMMADWIVQFATINRHSLRLAIVGSAFGLEVRDALLRLDAAARNRLHVTLLDLDPAAIDFARGHLAPLFAAEQWTANSTNLFRLPDRPSSAAALWNTDLLLCPGLFDYLDDSAAVAMLRCLYEQLSPSGQMTVFQFAPHNSTRAYMEWFGNWYLTYRDATTFRRLIETAELPAAVTYGAEPLGIDLFATITRSN